LKDDQGARRTAASASNGTATSLQAICRRSCASSLFGRDAALRVVAACGVRLVRRRRQLFARERKSASTGPDDARVLAREYRGGGSAYEAQGIRRAKRSLCIRLGRGARTRENSFLPTSKVSPLLLFCLCSRMPNEE
jgi:hypothetical protein